MVPPKVSLLKLTQGATVKELYEKNHFIQDMLVPIETLKDALKCFEKEVQVLPECGQSFLLWILYILRCILFQIYPVWLCPFKLPAHPGMLRTRSGSEEMFVDIGTYGVPKVGDFHPVQTTRRVESFVRSVRG